jgi:hypothetical protein
MACGGVQGIFFQGLQAVALLDLGFFYLLQRVAKVFELGCNLARQ